MGELNEKESRWIYKDRRGEEWKYEKRKEINEATESFKGVWQRLWRRCAYNEDTGSRNKIG